VAQRHELVAPELGANRVRHSEAVNVEDAAADAVLRDIIDERYAIEPESLQPISEIAQAMRLALPNLDPARRQRAARLLAIALLLTIGAGEAFIFALRKPWNAYSYVGSVPDLPGEE
jgi:hypothetical protein